MGVLTDKDGGDAADAASDEGLDAARGLLLLLLELLGAIDDGIFDLFDVFLHLLDVPD